MNLKSREHKDMIASVGFNGRQRYTVHLLEIERFDPLVGIQKLIVKPM